MFLRSADSMAYFTLRCKVVEPTDEERATEWGRHNGPCDMKTAEQHAAADIATLTWVEVVEQVKIPEIINVEDAGCPLEQEIFPMFEPGQRFPVIGNKVERGEISCSVAFEPKIAWRLLGDTDVRSTRGTFELQDGLVMCEDHLLALFKDGEWAGKTVWITITGESTGKYQSNVLDDGMWFNDGGEHEPDSVRGERHEDIDGQEIELI